MPFRKLKLMDNIRITYKDADTGEQTLEGQVLHVGKNRDILVLRDIHTDENYHIHIKDVTRMQELKTKKPKEGEVDA